MNFSIYIWMLLLNVVCSFTPQCSTCKHFIPDNEKPVFGLCNMFQDTVYFNNAKTLVRNLAIHCRNNENLCGKAGFLYEPIQNEQKCSCIIFRIKTIEHINKHKNSITNF
jgi:hypothetical protein